MSAFFACIAPGNDVVRPTLKQCHHQLKCERAARYLVLRAQMESFGSSSSGLPYTATNLSIRMQFSLKLCSKCLN
eukprot:1762043-Pleurochrysis_carterae.AAC.1